MQFVPVPDEVNEAWESLASEGAIPFEWIDDPRRCFAHDALIRMPCKTCSGKGCSRCDHGTERNWTHVMRYTRTPHSPDVCRAVRERASDMITAEAYALEAVRALHAWGVTCAGMFVWRFSPNPAVATPPPVAYARVMKALERVREPRGWSFETPVSARWFLPYRARWDAAVRAGLHTPAALATDAVPYSTLADPFRPLEEMFRLRVTLFDVSPTHVGLTTRVEGLIVPAMENPTRK